MKGDFSRSSFNSAKHYRGVRLQQGRIQLDADWNEQIDILLHYNARELKDMIGPYGAPEGNAGFAVTLPTAPANPAATGTATPPADLLPPDVLIAKGQRYVNGILCINEADCSFTTQPDFPGAAHQRREVAGHLQQLVYLDVWQHHITAREDGELREIALDGLDTTTRIQTVAQVKFWPLPADVTQNGAAPTLATAFQAFLATKQKPKGKLSAQKTEKGAILQNQLYRIEIHSVENDKVTFKWSRENGAIAYSVQEIKVNPNNTAQLDIQLKDVKSDQIDLRINEWVEIGCNDDALDGNAGVFGKVIDIQPDLRLVTVQPVETLSALDPATCAPKHMVLQRWDQRSATGVVERPVDTWLTLENELQVKFSQDGEYAVGDYWLIPARANLKGGTGDIIWPAGEAKPPAGTEHHYAPLACLQYAAGQWQIVDSETITFGTLPIITKKVDEVVDRVTQVEAEIVDLKARVTTLEEQMAEVLTLIKREQTSLYQNFKSSVVLEKGLVVAIDPSADFHVVPANLTNETLVLGIVDEIIPGDFPYRVIFQGRAQCKVVGPVKVGDLLTPTELDGHAGRGGLYLRPGTIIGKALRTYLPDAPEDVGLLDVMIIIS